MGTSNAPIAMIASLLSTIVGGCLDYTPIAPSVSSPPAADASVADGPQDSAPTQADPCLACAASDAGCPNEYAACIVSESCKAAAMCTITQCLASLATAAQCLSGCETEAGVAAPGSQGNAPFTTLLSCMALRCEQKCIH